MKNKSFKYEVFLPQMSSEEKDAFSAVVGRLEKKRRSKVFKRVAGTAGSVFVLVAVMVGLFEFFPKSSRFNPEVVATVISATPDESKTVFFSDASTVRLSPGSRISQVAGFSATNRKVSLDGEGVFDISSDREHPFEISSGECLVKVFGTRFNLSASEQSDEVSLTLIRGAVEFSAPSVEYKMVPGESLTYSKSTKEYSIKNISTSSYQAWLDGEVEFMGYTLSDLADSLSLLYGKEINVDPYLKRNTTKYSIRLINRESFECVMRLIGAESNANVTFSDTGATLSRR
ncbi:MAG: FecR domain-containing protein [Bacteroidales bacterium]|nr:FecR domain-containing protein [Bacteroidales bacterium]